MVIHPALDPQRDRLQPVIRGVAVTALLTATIVGAVSRSHPPGPQLPVTVEPTPFYQPPAGILPTEMLPSHLTPSLPPFPGFTPDPISSLFPVLLPGKTAVCPLLDSGTPCTDITVEPGDTLSFLACRYRTSVTMLQELNGLGTATTIKSGQQLMVPDPKDGPAPCG